MPSAPSSYSHSTLLDILRPYLYDEYCNSSPRVRNGWSLLFMSIDEPSVNINSLILPSHNNPIFQF